MPSTKNLIALGIGFFLAIIFWWLGSSESTPRIKQQAPVIDRNQPNELDHIEHAVRLARAWHAASTGQFGAQLFRTEEDIICPSETHTVTRSLTPAGPGDITEEFITTGNTLYAREAGRPWRSAPDPVTDHCQNGPSAGAQKLLTLLVPLKRNVRVTAGPVITLASGPCRLFDLSGAANLPFHSICVDEATHLPRRLQLGGLLVEYSNWNQPVIIEPPEMRRSHP